MSIAAAGGLLIALLAPAAAVARPGDPGLSGSDRQALSRGSQVVPKAARPTKAPAGPNPFLALLPDPARADYAGWRSWAEVKSDQRAAQLNKARAGLQTLQAQPILVEEDEPAGARGSNDTPATAQRVPGFGTGASQNPKARILGTLSPGQARAVSPNREDDGSIPRARNTGIVRNGQGITTSGVIGDGPYGSSSRNPSGDFDFYKLTAPAGATLTVDIDTPTGDLDSMLMLYDAAGRELAFNDDTDTLDSFLSYTFVTAGTYYVMVTGFFALPEDPFDSSSGTGAASEGPYNIRIAVGLDDVDFYAVRLRKGDVLGASVAGGARMLTIYDTVPRNVHGSNQDATFILPPASPLPGGGNAVTDHVAEVTGWHYIAVSAGSGRYDVTAEVYRPALEGARPVQTLFLDFNGARLNTNIFGGPGVRTLSPLRAFLGNWGLTRAQENRLIDRIVAVTAENVRRDMIASGLNERFRLRILNSRDHADPWGRPNVSRVIVGGTIEQSGIPTIGIAQSIDPGNFETEESALVLLDVLSGDPAEFGDASLNFYLTPASNRIRFIGQAIGNITAHEAGHLFGDYHVDQFNDRPNIMDQGGNFPVLYGVGPDGVGGTADDIDVDFGEDVFNPNEGFTGIEDTLSRVALAVTS